MKLNDALKILHNGPCPPGLQIDLSHNDIGDKGIEELVKALRKNATLTDVTVVDDDVISAIGAANRALRDGDYSAVVKTLENQSFIQMCAKIKLAPTDIAAYKIAKQMNELIISQEKDPQIKGLIECIGSISPPEDQIKTVQLYHLTLLFLLQAGNPLSFFQQVSKSDEEKNQEKHPDGASCSTSTK